MHMKTMEMAACKQSMIILNKEKYKTVNLISPFIIGEIQNKTIGKYHFNPTRMAKILQESNNAKHEQGCRVTHCWWEC